MTSRRHQRSHGRTCQFGCNNPWLYRAHGGGV